jgi:hypothetical protein
MSGQHAESVACPWGYRGPLDRIYRCTSLAGHTDFHVCGKVKWTGANPRAVLIDGSINEEV